MQNRLQMVDVRRLEQALRKELQGEVRFDDGARAAYSHDASNYRQVPLGVVLPRHVDDVVAALAICRAHDASVLARGGGTAQSGQGVNVGVVIDCSKYLHRVISVDAAARRARVEPGVVLRHAARRRRARRPDLRARSGDALALHPRRHDRQQLLRARTR
jgi:FAD/FMN-containing dehydrogenase